MHFILLNDKAFDKYCLLIIIYDKSFTGKKIQYIMIWIVLSLINFSIYDLISAINNLLYYEPTFMRINHMLKPTII